MNRRPDFASELVTLQSEVAADVGGILDAVKARKTVRTTTTDQEAGSTKQLAQPDEPRVIPAREKSRRTRSADKLQVEQSVVLDNVTTRLRRETNELLTEASLHQRLKKRSPATRQDIIEEAVHQWLCANGYRDKCEN